MNLLLKKEVCTSLNFKTTFNPTIMFALNNEHQNEKIVSNAYKYFSRKKKKSNIYTASTLEGHAYKYGN